jgi:hypothetical protein
VFIDGLNDFILNDPAYTGSLQSFMNRQLPQVSPWRRLPVVAVAQGLLEDLRTDDAEQPDTAAVASADDYLDASTVIDRYLANKRMIEAVAAAYQVATLFVWQPVPTYKYDLQQHLYLTNSGWRVQSGDRTRDGYSMFAARIDKAPLPGAFLWLADMQQDLKEPLYVDQVHYTSAMSRRIAEAIADRIAASGLLTRRPREGRSGNP